MDKQKALGAIYGLGIGDAMGAPTELRTTEQIKSYFGGLVYDFVESPNDTFAREYPAGTITDDFSMSYYLMKEINNNNGQFDYEVAKKAITSWGEDEYYFEKFAGPTTRAAIEKIKAGLPTDVCPFGLINYNSQATNGGAMKVIPLAVIANGDMEKAIQYTIDMCRPTHFNSTAVSGAAAICCAAVEALKNDTTLEKIYEAAIWGAKEGRARVEKLGKISVAPDMAWKIEQAISLGKEAKDFDDLLDIVSNKVGTNIQVSESVPAVFAIMAGTNGDTMQSIFAATNVGGDTDTIAAMVGGILGGLNGIELIPQELIDKLKVANSNIDIENTVNKFVNLITK